MQPTKLGAINILLKYNFFAEIALQSNMFFYYLHITTNFIITFNTTSILYLQKNLPFDVDSPTIGGQVTE